MVKTDEFRIQKFVKFIDIFSISNTLIGFLSIIYMIRENFHNACILLFIAVILDSLDGFISRKFKKSTEFGKNIDSFSDMISFGIAPAIFVYLYFNNLIISFVIIICGLLRLSRFNLISNIKKESFIGIPIPTLALLVCALYFLEFNFLISCFIIFIFSLLMISSIEYSKISINYITFGIAIILIFLFLFNEKLFAYILFTGLILYSLSPLKNFFNKK
ncbi:MAG: CDP-diacylglycerol--serine O-phosphatidyltransferase [Candidatus Aenigmarchaeota archaeon]|nr:CDP-diacylglycerol--serine O-phosphatidyltransferase [Candidatus Aenigmarchaeota archaeon]